MSYDVSVVLTDAKGGELEVYGASYTSNIRPMLHKAGMRSLLDLGGLAGREAAEAIGGVLFWFGKDPDQYRRLNPENEWGDHDQLVEWLEQLQDRCERWPGALVRVS